MSNPAETQLARYYYTALDKLCACTLGAEPSTQRFYLGERLSTEIQGTLQQSIIQHENLLLAQQQRQAGALEIHLLATDQQRSVLALLNGTRPQQLAYSPYGHRVVENGLLSLLGFNGERPDPVTGCYFLGNGYRAFSPVLMRFHCADRLSPFGRGGINAYGYCLGDPVNSGDPTGHAPAFTKFLKFKWIKTWRKTPPKPAHNPLTGTYRKTETIHQTTNHDLQAMRNHYPFRESQAFENPVLQRTPAGLVKIRTMDLKPFNEQQQKTIEVLSAISRTSKNSYETDALNDIINLRKIEARHFKVQTELNNLDATPARAGSDIRNGYRDQ